MKLIESKVEFIPQEEGLDGIYKQIEKCARTCYKSENKITEDSAKGFVDKMIKSRHNSMLEHGTVYLNMSTNLFNDTGHARYGINPYSTFHYLDNTLFITTNYRVITENHWESDLEYLVKPTEHHEKRYTFKFICSRGIADELCRHRAFSFAMESTRYVNYSKSQDIEFIRPSWANLNPGKYEFNDDCYCYGDGYIEECPGSSSEWILLYHLDDIESSYRGLIKDKGLKPQEARDILPLSLKTELCMTGFTSDWRYLLDVRLFEKAGKVHPSMKLLMERLQKAMQEAGVWEDIMKYPSRFEE